MSRYATIDVGSNSVLIHIAEKSAGGKWKILDDQVEISRLGESLQATGELQKNAMDRTVQALADFMKLAEKYQVEQVAAVGTMALRVARNSADFIQRVKDVCDLQVEVIHGEDEARLSYLAVKSGIGLAQGNLVIFDVGGGSTEFIFGEGDKIQDRFSRNIGALRLTEQILKSDPVTPEELAEVLKTIESEFADLKIPEKVDALVGMGGTITNLAAVKHQLAKYNPDIIQGSVIELAEIERQMEMYRSQTIEERKKNIGLQPKRADVILAGCSIINIIMKKMGVSQFTVSDRGVRHGLMVDRFGK